MAQSETSIDGINQGPEQTRELTQPSGSIEHVAQKALEAPRTASTPNQDGRVEKNANDGGKQTKEQKPDEEIDLEKLAQEHKEITKVESLHVEQTVIAYGMRHILEEIFQSMAETPEPVFTKNQRKYALKHLSEQLNQMNVDQKKIEDSLNDETRPGFIKEQNKSRYALLGRGLSSFAKSKAKTSDASESYKSLLESLFDYAFSSTSHIHKGKDTDESKKIMSNLGVCKKLYLLALIPDTTRKEVESYFTNANINPKQEAKNNDLSVVSKDVELEADHSAAEVGKDSSDPQLGSQAPGNTNKQPSTLQRTVENIPGKSLQEQQG